MFRGVRYLAPLCVMAAPALAEDTLRVQQGAVWPEIYYHNDGGQTSNWTRETFVIHGITVQVEIKVQSGPEIIVVTTDDPMVVIEPQEAEVEDGDDISVKIIPPLF